MADPVQTSFWAALFDWLSKKLPPLIAAFGLGYKAGKSQVDEKDREILDLKLKVELEKNENDVQKSMLDKSDLELVRESIADGGGSKPGKADGA